MREPEPRSAERDAAGSLFLCGKKIKKTLWDQGISHILSGSKPSVSAGHGRTLFAPVDVNKVFQFLLVRRHCHANLIAYSSL